MNTKAAGYLIFYGGLLVLAGLAGYLSNPEKAKTALISGGTFGALSILWGVPGASTNGNPVSHMCRVTEKNFASN